MRYVVITTAVLVFAALLIIDPVALAELGYDCVTGHCGVRPRWIWTGAGALVLVWACSKAISAWQDRPPPPPPPRRARATQAKGPASAKRPSQPKRAASRPAAPRKPRNAKQR